MRIHLDTPLQDGYARPNHLNFLKRSIERVADTPCVGYPAWWMTIPNVLVLRHLWLFLNFVFQASQFERYCRKLFSIFLINFKIRYFNDKIKIQKSFNPIVELHFLFRIRPSREFLFETCRTGSIFTTLFPQKRMKREKNAKQCKTMFWLW